MQTARSARPFALVATVLLLALLVGGCGRRAPEASDSAGASPVVTAPAEASAPAPATAPATAPPPTATAGTTAASAAPVPTPDLAAVDALLRDIDNDLQADASAGTNEGTAP